MAQLQSGTTVDGYLAWHAGNDGHIASYLNLTSDTLQLLHRGGSVIDSIDLSGYNHPDITPGDDISSLSGATVVNTITIDDDGHVTATGTRELASTDLTDGSNIAHINANETISGDWTFSGLLIGTLYGAATGASDGYIWRVSGAYPTYGIYYNEGDPDKIEFHNSGTANNWISLDGGAWFDGDVTLTGKLIFDGGSVRSNSILSLLTTAGGAQTLRTKSLMVSTTYTGTPPDNGIRFFTDVDLYRSDTLELTTNATIEAVGLNASGNVTGANLAISNWNDAYGWGNHGAVGYLVAADLNGYTQASVDETISGNWTFSGNHVVSNNAMYMGAASRWIKYGVYSAGNDNYGIGMVSGLSYGGLNDWGMTFVFADENDRGFWWGDATHTAAQGAMALTTQGKLTVAHSIRVGYGETDTTIPGATYALDVNGSLNATTVYSGGNAVLTNADGYATQDWVNNTFSGSTNITTLGTIGTGTWQGTAVADGYIASASNWNTAYGWGDHDGLYHKKTEDVDVSTYKVIFGASDDVDVSWNATSGCLEFNFT
jgi:hypothetical protein